MSRNSSGRSSYSYKSQEDFQDEILDLKRQLARLKEESRTLKVKLRRSEENAARKEKIICNMIDPLKAHLSAKPVKCQKKGSSNKEAQIPHKSTSGLNVYHHSTCSRAYRHCVKSNEIPKGEHHKNGLNELTRPERRKKYPSHVTTVIESIPEVHDEPPKAVLKVRPLAVTDCTGENCSPVIVNNSEVTCRSLGSISKNRDLASSSPVKSSNPRKGRMNKKTIKGKTKKKKSPSDKNARSILFQLCASSENEEDSYSSYVAVHKSKTAENAEVNHCMTLVGDNIPHDSDNCRMCHSKCLKSIGQVNNCTNACEIENKSKRGKYLHAMWNEDNELNLKHISSQENHKSNCGHRTTDCPNLSKEYASKNFGMYLINEHDEVEDSGCADIIVAEDESETLESWREVDSKTSPSCLIERRASIFRVDIKKKDQNAADESFEDTVLQKDSSEMIYRKSCCKVFKESGHYGSNGESIELHEVPMDADCRVLEDLLGTLSVADTSRNNLGKMDPKREKCLRNTLENLLAASENEDYVRKHLKIDGRIEERTNMKELISGPNCSQKCLTGNKSRQFNNILPKVSTFHLNEDFFPYQECGMDFNDNVPLLGALCLPYGASSLIPATFEII